MSSIPAKTVNKDSFTLNKSVEMYVEEGGCIFLL